MTKPQQRGVERRNFACTCAATALQRRRWSIGQSGIDRHSQPFHGVTCVRLARDCSPTGPRENSCRNQVFLRPAWWGRTLFRRGSSCRWGIMAYWAVFEEHFLHYDDFPRHCKWLTSVDRYPSTMERKLVVGIRDFCILSSRKACLEGNEKEKLTREVLSVLMVAPKTTRRRVGCIK